MLFFKKILAGKLLQPTTNVETTVSAVVRRCYGILIGLAKIRDRLPREIKRLLIEALVSPVRYRLSVWGSFSAKQRRECRKLNFGARESYEYEASRGYQASTT